MKTLRLFFSLGLPIISLVYSCTKEPIQSSEFSCNELNFFDTKVVSEESETIQYKVNLNDAMRFSELRKPGEHYKITPYLCGADTVLYILNYSDGWVVVPGDRRVDPLIAASDTGYLNMDSDYAYVRYIRSIAAAIGALRNDRELTNKESSLLWESISPTPKKNNDIIQTKSNQQKWVIKEFLINSNVSFNIEVPHLIRTKWGQNFPWNEKLPEYYRSDTLSDSYEKCVTGCVSVAVSQVLYYLHYKLGEPSALCHNIGRSYLRISMPSNNVVWKQARVPNSPRWDQMQSLDNPMGSTEYVGDLMMDVGDEYNTYYADYSTGSGAYMSVNPLKAFGITCSSSNHYTTTVCNNLYNNLPVIVTAEGHLTNGNPSIASHAWIIDGLRKETWTYTKWRMCFYTYDWTDADETYDTLDEVTWKYGLSGEGDYQEFQTQKFVYSYLMNWGEDGNGDEAFYYANNDWLWNNTLLFNNKKKIYYGFKKI